MKILIAIPCYNCEKQIARVLEKFRGRITYDTLLVDNKSTDGTARVIEDLLASNQTLIKHDQNYGLGGSFRTICAYAEKNNYEYLALFHGDDQASVDDLLEMIRTAETDAFDCLFGARFMAGSHLVNYSEVRSVGNRVINSLYSFALRKKIQEIGSGLNLYRVSSLPMKEIRRYPSHMAFDINLLFHFVTGPYRYKFLPIKWTEEDQVSNARNVKVGLTVLHMLLKHLAGIRELSVDDCQQSYEVVRK